MYLLYICTYCIHTSNYLYLFAYYFYHILNAASLSAQNRKSTMMSFMRQTELMH